MTLDQLRADLAAKTDILERLAGDDDAADEFATIYDEAKALKDRIAKLEDIQTRMDSGELRVDSGEGTGHYTRSRTMGIVDRDRDPFEVGGYETTSQMRGRVLEIIERAAVHDDAKQVATRLAERDTVGARWAAVTANPAYVGAFMKVIANDKGHLRWTDDERRAYDAVESFRAASLTDNAGGYMVPFILDPSVINTGSGGSNPFRQFSRVVTGTSDVWNGVSAPQSTASWDVEAAAVSDDTPSPFAQPSITAHKAAAFIPGSIEFWQDGANAVEELTRHLVDALDVLEAEAFATGSGSNEPFGIASAVGGTANAQSTYAAGSALTIDDVYAATEDLPARYRANASWVMAMETINDIRQFGTADGHQLLARLGDGAPGVLLGKPLYESSFMDSDTDAAGTALNVNTLAVYGDFRNYVIYDRIGTTVEVIPHLFDTSTGRPTGERGIYVYKRVGADSVNDNAFQPIVTSYSG